MFVCCKDKNKNLIDKKKLLKYKYVGLWCVLKVIFHFDQQGMTN